MHKSKANVEEEFGDAQFFSGDEAEGGDFGVDSDAAPTKDDADRLRPARQRLELRAEQRSLRQQLSDWDDYNEDFDTDL